ncbi:U-box domain-containing protein 51 isoform X3 [Mercurialis annua]|uniref:U-box domain-containing protein 51 isoform X3 n=1 Tax=Mercurialis annua TaxID=3986 RepID=UPI00215E2175|nr:U-box domain-containing protein 51 isoform X3 [Mercurialis annua]
MALVPSEDSFSLVNTTAVAIDKDKNSQHAVRWAIDHLIVNNPIIVLIHVRHKTNLHHRRSVVEPSNGNDHDSDEVQQLFIPFRGYCARKGVQLKEIVLEENDVARALLEFISKNFIGSIAVGASTRNALTRKFKNQDVPTSLIKSTPDFCSVYVISKGKIASVRTAQRPANNPPIPPKVPAPLALPAPVPQDNFDHYDEGMSRGSSARGYYRNQVSERLYSEKNSDSHRGQVRDRIRSPSNVSMDSIDISFPGSAAPRNSTSCRDSTSEDPDFSSPFALGSIDISSQNSDFALGSPKDLASTQAARDIESEMRRLKLELRQTIDMYSTACREALSAKKKANELHQWKIEEVRRFEEARHAEEAALAIAEMEKAKCKAAMEAAEKAQRLAEMEAQKRKFAELKAKQEAEEKHRALNALAHNDVRYRKYSIEEIEEATEKFAMKNKIGEGGYGPVYKGKLDHTAVAIKVLRPDAAQGKKQFQQEVEVLSSIRHPHMVLLLGACPEYGCLVYEYMDNGSLEDRLLRKDNTPPISWRKRFKIASEIATALLFLHQAKPEPLVHRDLKPANILIDRNYVSKISDVGLARLVPPSVADTVTQYHLTSAAGTFCYIDPEYQQTGMLTTRSDIYSLGIMLLQIITAKPPMGLAHHVGKAIERGTFEEMLDAAVTDWPVEEAVNFAKLALKCAELRKKDRPNLATVIVPELSRLRDLGKNNGDSQSNNDHHHHHHHHHHHYRNPAQNSKTRSRSPLQHSSPALPPRISSITQEMSHRTSEGVPLPIVREDESGRS